MKKIIFDKKKITNIKKKKIDEYIKKHHDDLLQKHLKMIKIL